MPAREPPPPARGLRSYVRREGRMTPAQQRAVAELLALYELPASTGALDLAAVYGRHAPLCVEIGCGTGTVLVELARRHPDNDYLGIEVYRPGLGRLLNEVTALGLTNVRVAAADALDVLGTALAPRAIEQLYVFFPDPWPKKRHHKRRLLTPDFFDLASQRLAEHGRAFVATDWPDYAESIEAALAEAGALAVLGRGIRPHWRPVSRYEARARREGRAVAEWLLAPA